MKILIGLAVGSIIGAIIGWWLARPQLPKALMESFYDEPIINLRTYKMYTEGWSLLEVTTIKAKNLQAYMDRLDPGSKYRIEIDQT